MSDSLTDSLNFVTQFLPKRACEGSPTTSHGDMEECPRCQVRVDREMVHHPVFGFVSMCGLKTSTAPPCTACGLREKVARLEFALAETETRRAAVDKLHAETLSALGADEHDLGPTLAKQRREEAARAATLRARLVTLIADECDCDLPKRRAEKVLPQGFYQHHRWCATQKDFVQRLAAVLREES